MNELQDVTISKQNDSIEQSDWQKLIDSDNELEQINEIEGRNPRTGETVMIPVSGARFYSNHSEVFFNFLYESGKITCCWCDRDAWVKGEQIAKRLECNFELSVD